VCVCGGGGVGGNYKYGQMELSTASRLWTGGDTLKTYVYMYIANLDNELNRTC